MNLIPLFSRMTCVFGMVLCVAACSAGTDTRLGGEGERCFTDEDCRGGLLCDDSVCTEDGDPNPDPNPGIDPPANCGDGLCGPGENDANCPADCGITGFTCGDVCAFLSGCAGEDIGQECTLSCERETEDLPQSTQQDLFQCLLNLSCNEALGNGGELCFEDVGDDSGGTDDVPPSPSPGPEPEPNGNFRFVLVEDGRNEGGENPGADIDAIGAILQNGQVFYATDLMDSDVPQRGNDFSNASAVLGAPDTGCRLQNFTALNGGFVLVSLRDNFSVGDTIIVHELGATECDRFDDDAYTVSISDNLGVFIQLGDGLGTEQFFVDF